MCISILVIIHINENKRYPKLFKRLDNFLKFLSFFISVVIKPFAELSMVKRLLEHSTVQQFRYFKVLVQEFHIKVDIVFINAIMGLFEANEVNDTEEVRCGTLSSFI